MPEPFNPPPIIGNCYLCGDKSHYRCKVCKQIICGDCNDSEAEDFMNHAICSRCMDEQEELEFDIEYLD